MRCVNDLFGRNARQASVVPLGTHAAIAILAIHVPAQYPGFNLPWRVLRIRERIEVDHWGLQRGRQMNRACIVGNQQIRGFDQACELSQGEDTSHIDELRAPHAYAFAASLNDACNRLALPRAASENDRAPSRMQHGNDAGETLLRITSGWRAGARMNHDPAPPGGNAQ